LRRRIGWQHAFPDFRHTDINLGVNPAGGVAQSGLVENDPLDNQVGFARQFVNGQRTHEDSIRVRQFEGKQANRHQPATEQFHAGKIAYFAPNKITENRS
jgi:hypothetical protein